MKKEILNFLKQQPGFVSGQTLCEQLGVSRTAIWKCINALKKEGYEIESVTRKGYRLLQSPEILTEEVLREYLTEEEWPGPIFYHASIDSTNEEAKRQAAQGAQTGTLYVADYQAAGRGRRGKNWNSSKGEDIFFTILLRPELPVECASMLTLIAALAAAAVSEKYSEEPCQIKWPNDILLHEKKICGILTEMEVEMGEISYVIIGIGFNINRKKFSPEIENMATSIYRETGKTIKRAAFLADFIREFQKRYRVFLKEKTLTSFVKEYQDRLINIGREVRIFYKKEEHIRTALGINERGELLVQDREGHIETIFSGEVSVRGLYGYV